MVKGCHHDGETKDLLKSEKGSEVRVTTVVRLGPGRPRDTDTGRKEEWCGPDRGEGARLVGLPRTESKYVPR